MLMFFINFIIQSYHGLLLRVDSFIQVIVNVRHRNM